MNEILLYTLDPYIISILFKTKTDEDTLEVYSKMVSSVDLVIKNTIKEFLMENGFSEEQVQKVLDAEDIESIDASIKPYMQNIILVKRIDSNSKQFIKLYYDQLLPNLSPEEKTRLENYLKDSEEVISKKKELVIENVKALKLILEENGVQTYDELRAKIENPEGALTEDLSIEAEKAPTEPVVSQPGEEQAVEVAQQDSTVVAEPVSNEVVPSQEEAPVKTDTAVLPEQPISQPVNESISSVTEPAQPAIQEVIEQPVSNVNEQPPQDNVAVPTVMPAQVADPQVGQINVTPIDQQQAVGTPDPLLTPTKATIVDDEQPQVNTTTAENNVNAVNQLQNMGIDLNDVLQPQPPQS